jgi:tetratricopeptide (TPR) repeat protein
MNMTAVRQPAAAAAMERARACHEAGDLDTAEAGYRDCVARFPRHAEAWHLYGVIAFQKGDLQRAMERISRALEIQPDYPRALSNLGNVMMAAGQVERAERLYRLALEYAPDYDEARSNLGVLLTVTDRPREALPHLERVAESRPDWALAHNNLGNALRHCDCGDRALVAHQRALELDPGKSAHVAGVGEALMQIGRHDEAERCFREALAVDPDCVKALCGLVVSRRVQPGDPEVDAFRAAFRRIDELQHNEKIDFLFAWGKLSDDIGEFEQAFACFAKANELRRLTRAYAAEAQERALDHMREVFTPERLAALRSAGNASDAPVFVLGMPRSGTTLTEQILASHSRVAAAGELKSLERVVQRHFRSGAAEPIDPGLLTPPALTRAAADYLNELPVDCAPGDRVTDKMPANFWYVGLIAVMFPRARIVHVRRAPMDNLLSCFQQNFTQGQAFSNGLESAAHYYAVYRRLMQHWHAVLGERLMAVDYEALVSEPEDESRRLAEFLGLEWEPGMLSPHRTRRSVRTASQWQVRQPIHRRSVERWRRYEKQLQPLVEALRGYGIDV